MTTITEKQLCEQACFLQGQVSNNEERRMASSRMLRHLALVKTEVLEEISASFFRVTRISELGTTLAVTS
jgi:hypothetical protein